MILNLNFKGSKYYVEFIDNNAERNFPMNYSEWSPNIFNIEFIQFWPLVYLVLKRETFAICGPHQHLFTTVSISLHAARVILL